MPIWKPFTQEKVAPCAVKIARGHGAYLEDEAGTQYLDLISSWWVNILGHANEEIADAIASQARRLEQVIFAGFSHEPAEVLCASLEKILPKSLRRFFFSDDGSTSVEVALKLAYQYFFNQGIKDRCTYINLEGAYHGDTLGAMSAAGNRSSYHSTFKSFFFRTYSIKFPDTPDEEKNALSALQDFLENEGLNICALIVEPLIQGAAGMRMYRAEFLEKIVNEVRKYGILVIFDEVMTGFGRTGTMFAMDQTQVLPDFICLSKGLTGGFLPLGLTVSTDAIYEAFYSDDSSKAFIHGHSYTANPISCAAAVKSLEILRRESTQLDIKRIAKVHSRNLESLPRAQNKRALGTIAAFEVESAAFAQEITSRLLSQGLIIRPLGNTIYFIPPYCIDSGDLERAYSQVAARLNFA
ncbi:MAG: adenosylmethionine--8-amino-7-oxononanoate transaminase [Holosporales bacterium]|nr:adenosylmethionine--8-amino-7-oxononanoate transaminase [Holosporales bacterium]